MTDAIAFPPTLVLNADYRPLSYYPLSTVAWQDAVRAIYQDRADVVQTYADLRIRSARASMPAPAVIALRRFVPRPTHTAAFTRFNVYLRDRFRCQYCGARDDLTFDHLIPASKGGPSTWTNVLTACAQCNSRKGDRTPAEAGLTLAHPPYAPTVSQLLEIGRAFPPPNLLQEWNSFCYWTVALDDDSR